MKRAGTLFTKKDAASLRIRIANAITPDLEIAQPALAAVLKSAIWQLDMAIIENAANDRHR